MILNAEPTTLAPGEKARAFEKCDGEVPVVSVLHFGSMHANQSEQICFSGEKASGGHHEYHKPTTCLLHRRGQDNDSSFLESWSTQPVYSTRSLLFCG